MGEEISIVGETKDIKKLILEKQLKSLAMFIFII